VLLSIPVGGTPSAVAVHPAGTFVYVVNQTSNFVSVIDAAINAVVTTIPVGGLPVGVALNAAGTRAYVTNSGVNTVTVANAGSNVLVTTVSVLLSPQGVAVVPDGTRVYVANAQSNSVSVIDANTNLTVGNIPVQIRPTAIGAFIGPNLALSTKVTLSAPTLGVGQTLTVGVEARNPAGGTPADLYVGALLPDGNTVVFFTGAATIATAPLSSPLQFRTLQAAPACFVLKEAAQFRFTFPPTGVPAGTYQVFAILARQGAFADNRIDTGDILAIDVKLFTFTP
jgi:YVTN family beta-propeller protein